MLAIDSLIGEGPTAPVVDEVVRRLCNPADAIVDEAQLAGIVATYGVGALALEGAAPDVNRLTPDEFRRFVVPSLLRAGFDSGIVAFDTSGASIRTLNKEKSPNSCFITNLPEGTIDQINASNKMVDELSDEVIDSIPQNLDNTMDRCVHAAHVMAKMAYKDKMRATGRPYTSHPEEIAAIVNYGLDEIRKAGHKVSNKTRALLICAALLHDALEEWRKPENYYQQGMGQGEQHLPKVLTPLAIKTTMEKLGMRSSDASYLANAVRLMTHEKGGKWMLTFVQYLYRGSGNRLVVPIKLTDMFHNLTVEPKPRPVQKPGETQEQYIDRVLYWDSHRGEYHYYVYENGYGHIDYEKNALLYDKSLKHWGPAYYEWLANLAYPDNPPNRAAVDLNRHHGKKRGSELAQESIPAILDKFSSAFNLELAA